VGHRRQIGKYDYYLSLGSGSRLKLILELVRHRRIELCNYLLEN